MASGNREDTCLVMDSRGVRVESAPSRGSITCPARPNSVAILRAQRPAHASAFRGSRAGGARRAHARSHGVGQRRRRGDRRRFLPARPRVIFESIASLAGEAQPCDPVTVSEHLQRLGKLNDAGGLAYLGTLTRDTPGAANVRAYAEIVKERALLRELVSAGGEIAELGVERRRRERARSRGEGRTAHFRDRRRAARAARDTSARHRRCRR